MWDNDIFLDIKKYRKKLGLTQIEFANELGISRVSLSDYETGKTPLPLYIEKAVNAIFSNEKSKVLTNKIKVLEKENKKLKSYIRKFEN